jgi:hypothetical protein
MDPPREPAIARAGLALRLRARWRRHALTAALARGADPDSSAELTLVARELIGARARRRLAAGFDRLLRSATLRTVPWSPAVPLNRREIAAARDELAELAARLRAASPVPARAVALAAVLLSDGTSPLYYAAPGRSALELARTARLALDDPIA